MAELVDDTIAIDRRLNAIILKGSPERIARLKAKIAAIDVPVQSVLLETMFVELDETGAKNVGLDFNNASNQLAVATYQVGAAVPSGFVAPSLASVSLQAAVYAQVQAGHGKIVSKPRIAAQSGSTAKIITGDALPILTSIALSGVNAVCSRCSTSTSASPCRSPRGSATTASSPATSSAWSPPSPAPRRAIPPSASARPRPPPPSATATPSSSAA